MRLFLDTANLAHIKKWAFLIDGITTNPTNLAKEGGDPTEHIKEICRVLHDKEVNVEVTHLDPQEVYLQAQQIAALGENVIVKIPCHEQYYQLIQDLVEQGVRVNITLVFSLPQALMMCKLGVEYISPFVGRLEENGQDGIKMICDMQDMIDTYDFDTELLAASIRSVDNFAKVIEAEVDVVTLPVSVFEESLKHPLTDQGIKKFLDDWAKLGVSKFP